MNYRILIILFVLVAGSSLHAAQRAKSPKVSPRLNAQREVKVAAAAESVSGSALVGLHVSQLTEDELAKVTQRIADDEERDRRCEERDRKAKKTEQEALEKIKTVLPKMRAWIKKLGQATHERYQTEILPNDRQRTYVWHLDRPQKLQSMLYPAAAVVSGFLLEFLGQWLQFKFLQNKSIPAHRMLEVGDMLKNRALARCGICCISIASKALFTYAGYLIYKWWNQPQIQGPKIRSLKKGEWKLTDVVTSKRTELQDDVESLQAVDHLGADVRSEQQAPPLLSNASTPEPAENQSPVVTGRRNSAPNISVDTDVSSPAKRQSKRRHPMAWDSLKPGQAVAVVAKKSVDATQIRAGSELEAPEGLLSWTGGLTPVSDQNARSADQETV